MPTLRAKLVTRTSVLTMGVLLAACGGGSHKGSSGITSSPQPTAGTTTGTPTGSSSPVSALPVEGSWDICITVPQSGGGMAYTGRRITLTQLASSQLRLAESFAYNLGAGCTGASGTRSAGDQGTITLLAGQVQGIGSTPVEFNFVSDNMAGTFPGKIALTGADQLAFLINYAASAATQFPADSALETFQRVTTP